MNPAEGSRLGTVLPGRFKVVDVLGRGGFGAVYRCEDLRLPGKRWALKELVCPDPNLAAEARRNFEREAHMLSALRHRSLPVIVDYFSEGDRTYLLMEEVEGRTLARLVEEDGPASEGEALRWALELARVLDYLHSQDPPVIFRDLKPENVMVPDDRHVKLIDFGLARHFDPGKRRDTEAMGSVGYAPPEVWEDASQTDARSDIYSLGATLYYALTGRPPSPVYGTHRLAPYRPDLSPELEAVVLRCMEPEPSARFGSTVELIRELLLLISRSDEPGPTGLPLREEARREPARRPASSSGPVAVASAEARPKPPGREPVRAASVPAWVSVMVTLATVLFLAGAILGFRSRGTPAPPPVLITHEIVNPEKDEAERLLEKGDLRQAAKMLDLAVTRHPSDAEAHILRENTMARLTGTRPLRIPAIMSLTGLDSPEGYRLLHGLAAAQIEFNRSGGLNGRPVVIDLYDDASDTERALEIAQRVIQEPDYMVVLGPFNSQRTLAVAPLFNASKLALLAPVASDPRVWEVGQYIFTASDSNFPRIRAIAHRLVATGYRKAAVLVDRDSLLSSSVAGYFKEQFESLGGQVVAELTYADIEFTQQIEELRAVRPDTVFFADYRGAVLAHFAHDLRAAGLDLPISSQVAPFTQELVSLGGEDAEGILLSGYFHYDSPRQEVRDYDRRFRQFFGNLAPTHLDSSAYDATRIVFQALRSGSVGRRPMREYLASIGAPGGRPPYTGVTGTFALARRLDRRDVYLVEIHEGKYRLLEKEAR